MSPKNYLRKTEQEIDNLPPAEALGRLPIYDLLSRQYEHRQPDETLIDRTLLRIYNAMLTDPQAEISQAKLANAISLRLRTAAITGPIPKHLIPLMRWLTRTQQRWHRQATRNRLLPTDPAAPPSEKSEARLRAQHLLNEDLYAFTPNQSAFKQHLSQQLSLQTTANY